MLYQISNGTVSVGGELILSHIDFEIRGNEKIAVVGKNGAGKTTLLKLVAGELSLDRDDRREGAGIRRSRQLSVGMLSQQAFKDGSRTVEEELLEACPCRDTFERERFEYEREYDTLFTGFGFPKEDKKKRISQFSGGEQTKIALIRLLLEKPDILLLDEPTKGLDAEFKQVFAEILQILLRRGTAVLMVSHDIEFCARYAHRCALFFDGSIVTEAPPRAFFSGNSFYTTSANRMARGLLPEAVTAEDVILACGGTLPPVPELPDRREPLPEPEEAGAYSKPKPLTWWRKLGAALTGAMAFLLFLSFMNITDLTKLITAGGMTELANHQMFLYALFILSLFLFAACITRRSHRKDYVLQVPRAKRKLAKRTIVAAVLILLLIPLTLYIGVFYLGNKKYYFISLMVLLECMLPFFLIFEGRKPQARELVIIAVLCAIGIAGRAAFFMLPQFKPVMALTIIAGVAFGGETGFLVGAMTMLASNVLFGQGPLTPWQMFAMGIIGFLAGLLFRKGLLRRNRGALCVFGALAAILIYGGIMNPASALTWVGELNEKVLLTYYISGLPFDCIQAAATWLFLWFGAEPMLEKLDRIKVKYGMVEV